MGGTLIQLLISHTASEEASQEPAARSCKGEDRAEKLVVLRDIP